MNTIPLKLSVLDLVPVWESADDTAALARAVELAQAAERFGYSRYWIAEHHAMPGLACPAPEVLLAHVGAHTRRIRIGSGAVLLPHYSPLKVAESFRLLAALYPGRIDLGLGRAPGGNAHASMALSGNFLAHVGQMPDKLQDIARLLQDTYTYDNESVIARPQPAIQPDIWLLGTNKKSAEYAAAFGMGYVFGQFMSDTDPAETLRGYREAFVPSPLCPKPRTIVAIGAVCAETDEEARQLAQAGGWPAANAKSSEETMTGAPKLLVGTAESIQSRLQQMAIMYEVHEFLLVTMTADYNKRLRSYELLAPGSGEAGKQERTPS
ncbi:LLM class flavin-dependent oxidoreductase [Paenibacillus athensensis]|uniref:Luciferase family oxidoreductase n=1 Tax=Paenibacillus athensensis TaxID=1967502 RepID=A0A4Y8Q9B0_9BACL|nr:LLM class flavin-dependent oxidoreductase [Paenibacillus athensensis]MCD1258984.1 LLM class flavin-dependent oxidoreductase [Paenibacillus athensensis]